MAKRHEISANEGGMTGFYKQVKALLARQPDSFGAVITRDVYHFIIEARAILSGGDRPPIQLKAVLIKSIDSDRIEEHMSMVDAAGAGVGAPLYRLDVVSGTEIAAKQQELMALADEFEQNLPD